MLIRISLIIAILAALAVGALNFVKVKEKITTLITERDDWHCKFDKTDAELTTTKKDLEKTTADLKQTKDTLEATSAERDKAVADAVAQTKKATELADKLSKTTVERDDARAELAAYVGTGFKPEQIAGLGKQIKQAQDALEASIQEKTILERALTKTKNELAKLIDPEYIVALPANLKGKILVTDPKWDFVVLDVGEDEGALKDGELLVSRNGRLVGKLRIRDVQKGRSIANVMPGWKITEVLEGDLVIPAQPAS